MGADRNRIDCHLPRRAWSATDGQQQGQQQAESGRHTKDGEDHWHGQDTTWEVGLLQVQEVALVASFPHPR